MQLPQDQIVVGDCLQVSQDWPQGKVDLIFADPPYNIGFGYDKYDDNKADEEYVGWTRQWITRCAELLKPRGSMFVLIGDEYAAETRLIFKDLERAGQLCFRNWIIWHYTFGQRCKVKFNRSHAHLFYAVGPAALRARKKTGPGGEKRVVYTPDVSAVVPPFTFNYDAIAVKSARQTTYKDTRANPRGKLPDDTWYLRPQEAISDDPAWFADESDTWYQSRLCGTFVERQGWHPCQLPEALLERIIKVASNPSDLVFDPFAGSGTTLAVAHRLKRHWLGCELSEDYAQKATLRILEGPEAVAEAKPERPPRKKRKVADSLLNG